MSCKKSEGLYFDIATAIYHPTFKVNKIVLPYKRAISSMQHDKYGIILGTYKNEVEYCSYSRFPVSIDVITAYMQDKYVEGWQGIDSIRNGEVLLQKFWKLNEELKIPFFTEIEKRESAYELILMGRYKYFVTDSVGFELPSKCLQMKLIKNIYTYPAFSHSPEGQDLQKIWDVRIIDLYLSGELFEIHSKYPANIAQWDFLQRELENQKDYSIG